MLIDPPHAYYNCHSMLVLKELQKHVHTMSIIVIPEDRIIWSSPGSGDDIQTSIVIPEHKLT